MPSLAPGIRVPRIAPTPPRRDLPSGVAATSEACRLQVALGLIWLVDAALQFQPYMFGRSFVTKTLEPAAAGNMWIVERPALLADHVMLHHITVYNSLFATFQLLIAFAILNRATRKVGLAVSVVWSFGVWWLAEGIGGVTNGASPLMGAPGAVILYALIALLVWPRRDAQVACGMAVADSGQLGRRVPKVLWAVLWSSFVLLGLEGANRAPSALHHLVVGMESGEPGWIKALDRGMAGPLAHHGTEVSIALAVLFGLVALGVFHPATVKPAVALAVVLGMAIWLAEDFGGIATASATDVNSGLPLVLLAACFWPLSSWDAAAGTSPPSGSSSRVPQSWMDPTGRDRGLGEG